MIFSDNYDKFRMAQIAYNSELEKYPQLNDLDLVTDFFGASLEGVNVRFKRIYDYLTTINTSSNQTENYSSVSDESLKGVALIKAIIKNAGIDSDFLTSVADMQVTTLPNLNISYQIAGNRYQITSNGSVLMFNALEQGVSAMQTFEKVAYLINHENNMYVVVREKSCFRGIDSEREELTDFIIDPNTKTIKYMRGVTLNNNFTHPAGQEIITNSYITTPVGVPCFISQTNAGRTMVQPLKPTPVFFQPEKTQIYLYDDDLCIDTSKTVGVEEAKQISKKFGKIVLESSKNLGLNDVFTISNGTNKGAKF